MIQRITSPNAFCKAMDDMYEAFGEEDKVNHHPNLPHDVPSIKNALANSKLLQWRYPTWGSHSSGVYSGLLVCEMAYNMKFNCHMLAEVMWLSKDGTSGYKMFKEAESFAIKNNIKVLVFSAITQNPIFNKLDNFYLKQGFSKDSITYSKIL